MLAASHIDSGRIRVHDFQCLPGHFLLDRPLLFACRLLPAHDFSYFNRGLWTRPGSDSQNKKLSNGVRSAAETATDRESIAEVRAELLVAIVQHVAAPF